MGRPRGGDHVGHVQVEPARALAPRGRDEAQGAPVRQQAQPATPVCRSSRSIRPCADTSRRPAPPATRSKSSPGSITLTRSCHRDPSSRGSRSRTAKSGQQHLAALLQRRLQLGRDRALGRSRVALRREAPVEHRRRERPEVGQPRLALAVGPEPPFRHARPQPPLPLGVARQHRPRPHQGRRRHHEARRPDEADPLQMGVDLRVASRHRLRRRRSRKRPRDQPPRRRGGMRTKTPRSVPTRQERMIEIGDRMKPHDRKRTRP